MGASLTPNGLINHSGNTANRPTGTGGQLYYNTDNGSLEVYSASRSAWVSIGLQDGSSQSAAAPSAAFIKSLTSTTTDGLYWINLPTVGPVQVYCDMNTYGGGWMLAMRLDSTLGTGTVRHFFDPGWWVSQTTSVSAAPATARTNGEVKTNVYGYYPHTELMLEYGYGSSYWANRAYARYTQPAAGNAVSQLNTTLAAKMATYHEGGGRTFQGYTTSQYRWVKQETNNSTFFPNAYCHLSFGSHANSNTYSNDFFRVWFGNASDLGVDSAGCNQVGGFGMCGDFTPSFGSYANPSTENPTSQSYPYNNGNASATISPPYGSDPGTCQWNGIRAGAGTSCLNYGGNTSTPIGADYYNNGIGLIWVR